MAYPKLLTSITVPSGGWSLAGDDGAPFSATITAGEYDTIIHFLQELLDWINDAATILTFDCDVSSGGIVHFKANGAWTISWPGTDPKLAELLGFVGDESVDGSYFLTATNRHRAGWYSPVAHYHAGTSRTMARRLTPTGDGSATLYGASEWHRRRVLRFAPLLESQVEPEYAEVADDGHGGTVDWTGVTFLDFWRDANSRLIYVYEDAADGTVDDEGDDGVEYYTAYREDEDTRAVPIDGDDLTWWSIELPLLLLPTAPLVDPE